MHTKNYKYVNLAAAFLIYFNVPGQCYVNKGLHICNFGCADILCFCLVFFFSSYIGFDTTPDSTPQHIHCGAHCIQFELNL